MRVAGAIAGLAGVLALTACSREKRVVDVGQPVTAPVGPTDPRVPAYRDNLFQVAQGGRYFSWYGCMACHGETARGPLDLSDKDWRHGGSIDRVFASITAHGPKFAQIPEEQRWQLAAYALQLPRTDPAYRRRQDTDQVGEPQAGTWTGPVK